MKTATIILLHIGYWLSYLLLVSFLYVLPLGQEPLPAGVGDGFRATLLGAVFPGVTGFYLFYFYLVPRLLARRNIRSFLRRGVLVSLAIGILFTVVASMLPQQPQALYPIDKFKMSQETAPWLQLWLFLVFSLIAGFNGIVSTVLRGFVTWYLGIRVKENLEKETLKIQLDLLKAQLHPHFLFNTLNNIDMLIYQDADAASRYLNHLSGMLRFMLYQSSAEQVPLSRELAYVNQYLELQKIRTDNSEFVECVISGDDPGLSIAPLLFLPFLENAFKHSANKRISRAISFQFDIRGTELVFTSHNVISSATLTTDDPGGLGLQLVRKRLEMVYQDRYELDIRHTETSFDVSLRLQLGEPG